MVGGQPRVAVHVELEDPPTIKRAVEDFAGDTAMRQTAREAAEARPPAAMAAAFARVIDGVLSR